MIDPFGLVLCTEGALVGNRSKLANLQQQFLKHVLLSSTVTKTGDVLGTWRINPKGTVAVLFGKKVGFLPIRCQYYHSKGKLYSTITTQWQKYGGNHFAPKKIQQVDIRPGGDKVDNQFSFEFLDPKEWQEAEIDFSQFKEQVRANWREPFMELFDKQKGKKRAN